MSKVYEGKPCIHGHGNTRYFASKACVECNRIALRKWRAENPAKAASAKAEFDRKRRELGRVHRFLHERKHRGMPVKVAAQAIAEMRQVNKL